METTMHVLKGTEDKGTRVIFSIPGSAVSIVLKFLHENLLPTDYVGLDQEGRLLMEVYFNEEQKHLSKQITEYIEQMEEFSRSFEQTIKEVIRKRDENFNAILMKYRKKWQASKNSQETSKTA